MNTEIADPKLARLLRGGTPKKTTNSNATNSSSKSSAYPSGTAAASSEKGSGSASSEPPPLHSSKGPRPLPASLPLGIIKETATSTSAAGKEGSSSPGAGKKNVTFQQQQQAISSTTKMSNSNFSRPAFGGQPHHDSRQPMTGGMAASSMMMAGLSSGSSSSTTPSKSSRPPRAAMPGTRRYVSSQQLPATMQQHQQQQQQVLSSVAPNSDAQQQEPFSSVAEGSKERSTSSGSGEVRTTAASLERYDAKIDRTDQLESALLETDAKAPTEKQESSNGTLPSQMLSAPASIATSKTENENDDDDISSPDPAAADKADNVKSTRDKNSIAREEEGRASLRREVTSAPHERQPSPLSVEVGKATSAVSATERRSNGQSLSSSGGVPQLSLFRGDGEVRADATAASSIPSPKPKQNRSSEPIVHEKDNKDLLVSSATSSSAAIDVDFGTQAVVQTTAASTSPLPCPHLGTIALQASPNMKNSDMQTDAGPTPGEARETASGTEGPPRSRNDNKVKLVEKGVLASRQAFSKDQSVEAQLPEVRKKVEVTSPTKSSGTSTVSIFQTNASTQAEQEVPHLRTHSARTASSKSPSPSPEALVHAISRVHDLERELSILAEDHTVMMEVHSTEDKLKSVMHTKARMEDLEVEEQYQRKRIEEECFSVFHFLPGFGQKAPPLSLIGQWEFASRQNVLRSFNEPVTEFPTSPSGSPDPPAEVQTEDTVYTLILLKPSTNMLKSSKPIPVYLPQVLVEQFSVTAANLSSVKPVHTFAWRAQFDSKKSRFYFVNSVDKSQKTWILPRVDPSVLLSLRNTEMAAVTPQKLGTDSATAEFMTPPAYSPAPASVIPPPNSRSEINVSTLLSSLESEARALVESMSFDSLRHAIRSWQLGLDSAALAVSSTQEGQITNNKIAFHADPAPDLLEPIVPPLGSNTTGGSLRGLSQVSTLSGGGATSMGRGTSSSRGASLDGAASSAISEVEITFMARLKELEEKHLQHSRATCSQLVRREHQLAEANKTIQTLQTKLERTQKSMDQFREMQLEERVKQIAEEAVKEKEIEFEAAGDLWRQEVMSLNKEIAVFKVEISKSEKTVNYLETVVETQQRKINRLQEELDRTKGELREEQKQNEALMPILVEQQRQEQPSSFSHLEEEEEEEGVRPSAPQPMPTTLGAAARKGTTTNNNNNNISQYSTPANSGTSTPTNAPLNSTTQQHHKVARTLQLEDGSAGIGKTTTKSTVGVTGSKSARRVPGSKSK